MVQRTPTGKVQMASIAKKKKRGLRINGLQEKCWLTMVGEFGEVETFKLDRRQVQKGKEG